MRQAVQPKSVVLRRTENVQETRSRPPSRRAAEKGANPGKPGTTSQSRSPLKHKAVSVLASYFSSKGNEQKHDNRGLKKADLRRKLAQSAREGDFEQIQALLNANTSTSINVTLMGEPMEDDDQELTGHDQCVALILETDAPVDCETHDGESAMSFALALGSRNCSVLLLNAGASLAFTVRDANGEIGSPLHAAASRGWVECVNAMLSNDSLRSKLNVCNAAGQSALMLACKAGAVDVTRGLLLASAAVAPRDKYGKSALDYARVRSSIMRRDPVACGDNSINLRDFWHWLRPDLSTAAL
ncbi:hypothetical protein AB1Y20_021804 [Prymnesium parvum]|uniref:Uncharacterized protein n=1 Tax=Prymnesium parvum TaxID=97485 RepID=A0AB34JJC8_PRYPA